MKVAESADAEESSPMHSRDAAKPAAWVATPLSSRPYYPLALGNGSDGIVIGYTGSMCNRRGHDAQHQGLIPGWYKCAHRVYYIPARLRRASLLSGSPGIERQGRAGGDPLPAGDGRCGVRSLAGRGADRSPQTEGKRGGPDSPGPCQGLGRLHPAVVRQRAGSREPGAVRFQSLLDACQPVSRERLAELGAVS